MEPDFARRAPRRTSGDPEPGEGDFTRYAVEVTNLVHRATTEQVQELFRRLTGLCSVSYTPRSGKATVELSSRSNAETAVRLINTMRELAYSPSGKSWTLRARMLAINANLSFTQVEPPQRWQFVDDSALEQWVHPNPTPTPEPNPKPKPKPKPNANANPNADANPNSKPDPNPNPRRWT